MESRGKKKKEDGEIPRRNGGNTACLSLMFENLSFNIVRGGTQGEDEVGGSCVHGRSEIKRTSSGIAG